MLVSTAFAHDFSVNLVTQPEYPNRPELWHWCQSANRSMILAKTTSGRNCVDWHIKLREEWEVSIQAKGGVDPSFPELVQ